MNRIKNINRYRYNLLWMVEHFTYSKKANQLRIDLGNKLSEKISSEFKGIGSDGENHSPVPVIDGTNLEEFIKNYRKKSVPVVLKNVAS